MPTDKERLDWLEMMANQPGGLLLHDGSERGRTGLGLRPGAVVRTLREAIDMAMGESPAGVEPTFGACDTPKLCESERRCLRADEGGRSRCAIVPAGVATGPLTAPEYLAKAESDPAKAAALQRARDRAAGAKEDQHG
jgi:hypothetical protein